MTAKILQMNGEVVYRSTYRPLTVEERADPSVQQSMALFDETAAERLGDKLTGAELEEVGVLDTPEYLPYADEDQNEMTFPDLDDKVTPEAGDEYVHASVMPPRGSQMMQGTVKARKQDLDGNLIGRRSDNPILDTLLYDIEFPDGEVTLLTANAIAQAMYAQCNVDGNEHLLLNSFVDVQKDHTAIGLDKQKSVHNGREYMRCTTLGWHVCCQWKDGSMSWEKQSDIKESHPLQIAEYAVAMQVDHEPGFNCWVLHTLKKHDAIIAIVNNRSARYLKRMHKFGIECPKTVEDALELDKRNGNTMWANAIAKEMKNVQVAFDPLEDGMQQLNGYQFVRCHMIFDVKMEDFSWKAPLVAGGYMPPTVTHASIVLHETVRIALIMAALNALKVTAADIINA